MIVCPHVLRVNFRRTKAAPSSPSPVGWRRREQDLVGTFLKIPSMEFLRDFDVFFDEQGDRVMVLVSGIATTCSQIIPPIIRIHYSCLPNRERYIYEGP